MDLDASKAYGFGVMIYHVRGEPKEGQFKFRREDIEPICFLSKGLTTAESHYWPTELEVACLVWAVKRIRHMIEAARVTTIAITDHSSTTNIVKQTKLSTSCTDRSNLRLIRASTYLSQFDIEVRHKPGKEHLVPDALSRLISENEVRAADDDSILDTHAYQATLVTMSESYSAKLQKAYDEDKMAKDTRYVAEDTSRQSETAE